MNLLQKFEAAQLSKITEGKIYPEFRAGDTVRVRVNITEGMNERIQAFEGVVIRIRRKGIRTTFTVKKVSNNESVERIFMLYSPRIDGLEVVKRGKVRRAKLYYMRELKGKKARIAERKSKVRESVAE